jgi:hypothetical protein
VSRDDAADWIPAALLEHAVACVSKSAFDADHAAHRDRDDTRWNNALAAVRKAGSAGIAGRCPLCDAPRRFVSPDNAAGAPNLREGLICQGCRTNARVRVGLAMLQALCPDRAAPIYITEQVSSAYRWLRRRYPATIGSEFAPAWWHRAVLSCRLWMRGIIAFVRCEDVTGLTLPTASQGAVASFDVLEHVADYRAALREFARVTASDGWLVLTAPFSGGERGIERARVLADGRVEYLHPAEYHGDPLGGGALCFHHFGWDLLDDLRAAGYRHAAVVRPWWPEAGLFDGLAMIVARR